MQPQSDAEELCSARWRLYKEDRQYDVRSERVRDHQKVYVPKWGPEKGFRKIDYFHGLRRSYPFNPIARLCGDKTYVESADILSAEPGRYLDKKIREIQRRWRNWRIRQCLALARAFTKLRPPLPPCTRLRILSFWLRPLSVNTHNLMMLLNL